MKTAAYWTCVILPLLFLGILFSSCGLVEMVNKNLETPSPTDTYTATFTPTPTPVPTDTPTPLPTVAIFIPTPEPKEVQFFEFNTYDTQHWQGKVQYSEEHPREGKGCLEIDATGSKGWNQELAVVDPSAMGTYDKLFKVHFVTVDVFVPRDSFGKNQAVDFDFVSSGPYNHWSVHKGSLATEGWTHLEYPVAEMELKDAWKFYFVVYSKEPLAGPLFIDNMMGLYER